MTKQDEEEDREMAAFIHKAHSEMMRKKGLIVVSLLVLWCLALLVSFSLHSLGASLFWSAVGEILFIILGQVVLHKRLK